MTEQMNVPKLRFEVYGGNWNHYSIKETITALVDCEHKTAPYVDAQDYMVVRTNNVKNGSLLLDEMKYTSKEGFEEWTKRAIPTYGDILFTREAPAGESCLVPKNTQLCLGQRMVLLRIDHSVMNSEFISQLLLSPKVQNKINSYCIGSTVSRINIADINRIDFDIPLPPEQHKIASFLSKVDEKIGLLSEKKDKLTEYKRGVMQQLFNGKWQACADSQDVTLTFTPPTLRFKADDGSEFPDWEEKKLGEVFSISAGGDIDKKHSNKVRTDKFRYPVFANAETNKGLYGYSDVYKVDQPCITVSGRGSLGNAVYRNEAFYPIVRLLVLKPQFALNLKFFEQTINKLNIYNESTGVPQLTAPQLKTYRVLFPSTNEQDKIASFLTVLEQKIALVNSELETAKKWKKGLLQQMFV